MGTNPGILIVDDDPKLRKTLSDILRAKGYAPTAVETGKSALASAKEEPPAVALIDIKLEDMSGLEVIKGIRELSPRTECIILTGHASQESAIEAVNLGAYSFIQKPYDVEHLLITIRRALEKRRAKERLERLNACFLSLGHDPKKNIETIVRTAGEILGGACMLYNRLEEKRGLLCTWGIWPRPEGYNPEDNPEGHICYDVIKEGREGPVIIEDLTDTKYEKTDPNVKKYKLKSYLGYPVRVGGEVVGSFCLCDVKKRKFTEGEIKVIGMLGKAVAIEEEHLMAEKTLRKSEAQKKAILDGISTNIAFVNKELEILWANKAAALSVNSTHKEMIGHKCHELWADPEKPCDGCPTEKAFRTKKTEHTIMVTPDGRVWDERGEPVFDAEGKLIGVVEIAHDITERWRLDEQLRHAQKMKAVGTLAGGIAHDFNNILGGILGYVSLMKKRIRKDRQMTSDLETVEKLTWRGSDLTQALLTFSRKGEYHPEPLNINDIVREVLQVAGRTACKGIDIREELSPEVSNVLGDRGQLHQVIMNLCLNACESMPKGGALTIRTENAEPDVAFFTVHQDLSQGPYISLTVSDTGLGMDEETIERIFEPFFTTKAEKTGTGLGLSMVSGIVERHGGCVEVRSEPRRGSTFTVYLPATEEKKQSAPIKPAVTRGGDETILIVDDNRDFRNGTSRWLGGLGYTVLEAGSGVEALKALEERREDVALVLLDMIMKGMNGDESFRKMREMVPELAVIISTGYSLDNTSRRVLDEGARDFIQKPFDYNLLAVKIRQVLDSL